MFFAGRVPAAAVERTSRRVALCLLLAAGCIGLAACGPAQGPPAPAAPTSPTSPSGPSAPSAPSAPSPTTAASCLSSGDGYLRAQLAGAIEARIDWPNSGTRCQGETKANPPGVRLSFQREPGGSQDLLFVFGLTGIREGAPAHATGANLTIIQQGTDRIYGTLGDSRCTVDSLAQRPLPAVRSYRLEAHGFCTSPAHAVRGEGSVFVSTFDFAGLVSYGSDDAAPADAPRSASAVPHP